MRILKIKQCICGESLEYDSDDIQWDSINQKDYIECPVCRAIIYITDSLEKTITKFNLKFPDDFDDYSKGKDVGDETINRWIKEGITYLDNNIDETYIYNSSGNALVVILGNEYENEYTIFVSKNYREASVEI